VNCSKIRSVTSSVFIHPLFAFWRHSPQLVLRLYYVFVFEYDHRLGDPSVSQLLLEEIGQLCSDEAIRLPLAAGLVCVFCKVVHEREECSRLAYKQSHVRQELDYALGDTFGLGRPNN